MSDTTFQSGTLIQSDWLNDVNVAVYREAINPKTNDYGALGDGSTDDTVAITAAINAAYLNGRDVYWPAGTYLTTASIANFHNVKHVGPGRIKRGTDVFYPAGDTEGVTNTLYVATTGSDANDGLTASEPFLTTAAAANVLYGMPYADVVWKIQHAAGTYSGSTLFTKPFKFPQRVQFLGAAVSDGTTPTTIIQSTGASQFGLGFQSGAYVYVEDIFFKNYTGSGGTGLSGYSNVDLMTRNVWVDNCSEGIGVQSNSVLRVQAGKITACTWGITVISCCTYTIGYNGTAADINGVTGVSITGCTNAALIQEKSAGHIDYTYVGTSTNVGVDLIDARIHLVGNNFQGNNQNLRAKGNCNINDNQTTPNTWGTATASDRAYLSGSFEFNTMGNALGYLPGIGRDTTALTNVTATPSAKTVYTFPTWMLTNRNGGFDLFVMGDIVGTTGTKVVEVKLGGVSLGVKTLLAATADWSIEVKGVVRTATNDVRTFFRTTETGGTVSADYKTITTVNMTTGPALTVEITSNGTDTIRLQCTDFSVSLA